MTEPVISLLYSAVGFVLGYLVGRGARSADDISALPARERPTSLSTALGVAVVVLSVLTVAVAGVTAYETKRASDCQAVYNARFYEAFQARAEATDQWRESLDDLLLAIGDTSLTQPQRAQIYRDYLAGLRKSNETRANHPLPSPPNPANPCKR